MPFRDSTCEVIPVHEVRPSQYYERYLRSEDREPLEQMVTLLGKGLEEKSNNSIVIVAVGSSTFPKYYFRERKETAEKNRVKLSEGYEDIDLRVLMQDVNLGIGPRSLRGLADFILTQDGCVCRQQDMQNARQNLVHVDSITQKATRIKLFNPEYIVFDYNELCLLTTLRSGTHVDVLFGKEGKYIAAQEFLEDERKKNSPFCLLY